MTGHIISYFRAAVMDPCAECDMGIFLDFAVKYKEKASELFDLCVHHLCWTQKMVMSVASQLHLKHLLFAPPDLLWIVVWI